MRVEQEILGKHLASHVVEDTSILIVGNVNLGVTTQ